MYLTSRLRDHIAKIRRAITFRQGLSCIFGDNGYGKSTLLRHLGAGLAADEHNTVALVNDYSNAPRFTFLKTLSYQLGIEPQRSSGAQLAAIESFLVEQYGKNRNVILLIDEAQLLRLESLEAIRALLNFETSTEKMCQVVLAGQLDLRDRLLKRRQYKPFRSRVIAPVVLEYLSPEETAGLIQLRHEYWGAPNRFTPAGINRIHSLTHGIPRDIVALCGYACVVAEESGKEHIGASVVDQAQQRLCMTAEHEQVAVA